jgi:hypothetical protein
MELPPNKAIERRELPIFRIDHGMCPGAHTSVCRGYVSFLSLLLGSSE